VPLPRRLARLNLRVTNPVLRHAAVRLPGFAIIHHTGRRSGRAFTTPANLYRDGDRYVIALMYGRDSQWVRNVLAAGAFDVVTRNRPLHLVEPELVHDPTRSCVPAPVRPILRLLRVTDFLIARYSASPLSAAK
jgi:deazaflavin-dependent oxidoreductase (nitroreductase family)